MSFCARLFRTSLVVAACFLVAGCDVQVVRHDDSIAGVRNLDFEGGVHAGRVPNGWIIAEGVAAGRTQDYEFEVDEGTVHSGNASLRIRFAAAHPWTEGGRTHGGVAQCLRSPALAGRDLTLSGYLKTDGAVDRGASLWMEAVDTENKQVASRNMDRRARGTNPWQEHEVRISLPDSAEVGRLCFGFFHDGRGTVWADDLSLRVTGEPRQ